MKSIFFVLALGLALKASAQDFLPADPGFARSRDCAPVDYRAQLGKYKDQGETGFCYAYSSADLITQRTGIEVSAMDLASRSFFADPRLIRGVHHPLLREYLRRHPRFEREIAADRRSDDVSVDAFRPHSKVRHPMFDKLEGGFEDPTIVLANLDGLCTERDLPSRGGFAPYANLMKALEDAAIEHRFAPGREVASIDPRFRDREADIFNTGWIRFVNRSCHRVPSPVPLIPIGFSIADDLPAFYRKVRLGEIGEKEHARIFASLDYALDHGRIVSIGYDLNRLLDPNSIEVLEENRKARAAGDDGDGDEATEADGDHSSPIVARRMIDGQCHYLVRDPSGYGRDAFLAKYRDRWRDHHIWMTQEELSESFYSVVYLR